LTPPQSTSWNPLASLRSFAQSFVGRNEDDISISGSEDEWDGKVPEVMQGEDIFSLAAAAGRGGPDFEERSKTWREGKANLRSRPVSVHSSRRDEEQHTHDGNS
jgi:hypothetical protein